MPALKLLISLMIIGLAACASSSSHTQIDSVKTQDTLPAIRKMYLFVDIGQGPTALMDNINLINKDFNDAFMGESRACGVQAASIFDERWKIIRAAGMVLPNADTNKILKLDHTTMEAFHPDAVFSIKAISYTTTTQMATSRLSKFTYYAILTDYNSQKELWKGSVDLSPAASWGQATPDASPSAVLAHDVIRKMAADGVLNCPPEIPAH